MKKLLVSLCLALVVLLCAVTAMAATVPSTSSQVKDAPAMPTLDYSVITGSSDQLVIAVQDVKAGMSVSLYNPDTKLTESCSPNADGTFSPASTPANLQGWQVIITWADGSTSAGVTADAATGKHASTTLQQTVSGGEFVKAEWDASGSLVALFKHNSGAATSSQLTFTNSGSLDKYSYTATDGTQVAYSANGQLQSLQYATEGGNYHYSLANGWVGPDGQATTAPEGFNMANYPPLELEKLQLAASATDYDRTWYNRNTVCLAGLSVRDMSPEMTDKWYNIVPVDLTVEGVQVYPLVAGNLHHIGQASVTIIDGTVTVDYALHRGHGYVKSECVRWFSSYEDFTSDFFNLPMSELKFGQTLSIEEDLGGVDSAILFICNRVTYRQPYFGKTGFLSRYWPNRDRWVIYREELMKIFDAMDNPKQMF